MKVPRVNSSFGSFSDADFEQKAQYITACLVSKGSIFDSPNTSFVVLNDAVALYSERLLTAGSLGRPEIALKNEARQNLEANLVQLGNYVINVANGNLIPSCK